MPTPSNCVRAITAFVAVVLLNLYAALRVSSVEAAGIVAQAQTNTQPGAPPIFFFLLVLLIFVAVLAFSFTAFRDVNR